VPHGRGPQEAPDSERPKDAKKRIAALEAQEAEIAMRIEGLAARRAKIPRTKAAGNLPEGRRLDALPTAERVFVDLIRMFACRAETRMLASVGGSRDGRPDERALLRCLFASPADLLPDREAGVLRVRVRGQGSAAHEKRLEPLFAELDETRTIYPGTCLRLVCETAGTRPATGTLASDSNAGPPSEGARCDISIGRGQDV